MTQPLPVPPPLPVAPGSAAPGLNLTPDQLSQYATALKRGKKIRSAARVAAIDGGLSGFFAAGALLIAAFQIPFSFSFRHPLQISGLDNALIGLGLAWVSYQAFRGSRMIKQLNPEAAKVLALNQVLLAAILVLYFAYALWQTYRGNSSIAGMIGPMDPQDQADLQAAGFDAKGMMTTVLAIVRIAYLAMIAGTLLVQGLTALYYWRRRPIIEAYLRETPPWIVDLQRIHAVPGFPVMPAGK